MRYFFRQPTLPKADACLPGRSQTMPVPEHHCVNGNPLRPPFPQGMQHIVLGMGCFWGAEKMFWQTEGVFTTAVGYAGGYTPNPLYEEVCSELTGHTEVVLVVFDPEIISLQKLIGLFWEGHDPTQGMRQGNDIGTQYRSAIYWQLPIQQAIAEQSAIYYQSSLDRSGLGQISTEVLGSVPFYYAEEYHQQYLAKVPHGYCSTAGTGVCYTDRQDL